MKNTEVNGKSASSLLILWGVVAFFIIGFVAYWPALSGDFVWGDDLMLASNPLIKAADGLNAIWLNVSSPGYFPLTATSFWLEWRLWGANPVGYHVTNVLFHIANSVLLWRVLASAKISGGWLAGLLFLLHPVGVESVAWIAARKNVLALFFYLLALRAYLQFAETGRRRLYIFSWLAFALSLLSQPAGLMLPLVLLGLAWWRNCGRESGQEAGLCLALPGRRVFLSTLPFFVLALAMGGMAFWGQAQQAAGDEVIYVRDFWTRLAGAGWAVWFYLFKAIWPLHLSFVYSEWNVDSHSVVAYLPGVAVLGVFLWLWWQRQSGWGRTLLGVWGYFLLMVFPGLIFFQSDLWKHAFVADHWLYFALPAVLALIGAGEDRLAHQQFGQGPERPSVFFIRGVWCILLAGLFGALTWRQAMIYEDGAKLWRDTLEKNPASWLACNQLGLWQESKGQPGEAMELYRQSIRLQPGQVEGQNRLGSVFLKQGQPVEALAHYQAALQVNAAAATTHYNLGQAWDQMGKRSEAAQAYREALRLQPRYAEAHNQLAAVLVGEGKVAEGMRQVQEALQINPDYVDALNQLGRLLVGQGKAGEAVSVLQKSVTLKPEQAEGHLHLGNAWRALQQYSEALEHYQSALQADPTRTEVRYKLGDLLLKLGQVDAARAQFSTLLAQQPKAAEAHYQMAVVFNVKQDKEEMVEHLREAVRLKPNWVEALNNLAWFLATKPRATFLEGVEAVKFAERACEITGRKSAGALDTLGVAYAQTGQFSEAVNVSLQAQELASAAAQTNLVAQIQSRLELYRHQQPYRER